MIFTRRDMLASALGGVVGGAVPKLPAQAVAASGPLVFDVKAYGAVGDGVTDDRAALNAAIQAAAVSGGTVWIPAGVFRATIDPATKAMLTVPGPGVQLVGASREKSIIRLADNQGDYQSLIAGTDLSGLVIRDLTLDQNATGNKITNITNLMNGQPRYFVKVFKGSRILIDNCTFADSDNVNSITINGGDLTSDVVIRNNLFQYNTNSSSHDHSTIYTSCKRATIEGNTFVGAGISARTAIEVHGSSQIVRGNRIHQFFTGINVAGIGPQANTGYVVFDNIIEDCGVGIHLWSWKYGSNTSEGLKDVVVQGNTVTLDFDRWANTISYKAGILFDPGSSLPFRNVTIDSNVIRYKEFTAVPVAADRGSCGVMFERSSGVIPTSALDWMITISNNTIDGPPSSGMLFHPKCITAGLHVHNNTIANVGMNNSPNIADDYNTGIMMLGVAGGTTYRDLQLVQNTVADHRASNGTRAGVSSQFVTGSHPGAVCVARTFSLSGTPIPKTTGNLGSTPWEAY